jgi:hypothetical protein
VIKEFLCKKHRVWDWLQKWLFFLYSWLLLPRSEIYFPSPWIWTSFVTCFGTECDWSDGVLVLSLALRDLAYFFLGTIPPLHKQIQASLQGNERHVAWPPIDSADRQPTTRYVRPSYTASPRSCYLIHVEYLKAIFLLLSTTLRVIFYL